MERIELRKIWLIHNIFVRLFLVSFYTVHAGAEQRVSNVSNVLNNNIQNQDILDIVVFSAEYPIEKTGVAKVICEKVNDDLVNYDEKESESITTRCKSINNLRIYANELELNNTNCSERKQNLEKILNNETRKNENMEKLLKNNTREIKNLQQVISVKESDYLELEANLNKIKVDLQKTKDRKKELEQFFAYQCQNKTLENCSICGTTILRNLTKAK